MAAEEGGGAEEKAEEEEEENGEDHDAAKGEGSDDEAGLLIEAALAATLPPRRRPCVVVQRDLDEVEVDTADAAPSASAIAINFRRGLAASDGTAAAEEGRHAAAMRTRVVIRNAIP